MNRKTYLIDYEAFDSDNISLKKGQIKVKNKMSEFEAKCSLEVYLQKKYHNFNRLVVTRCVPMFSSFLGDVEGGGIDDFFNMFRKS
jgi:hypothetical protein